MQNKRFTFTRLSLFILLCIGGSVHAQSIIDSAYSNTHTQAVIMAVPEPPAEFAECVHYDELGISKAEWERPRPLAEVNDEETAEAYPYISADGLRLYFTHEDETQNMYMVSRQSIREPFGERKPVSDQIPAGSMSGWFSNDELELYFVNHGTLYRITRKSIDADFSRPEEVKLIKDIEMGFISGPSFTPDKEELYLYHHDTEKAIFRFKKTGPLTYTFVEEMLLPSGYAPGPGQLSKNGLSFYFSLTLSGNSRLCISTRPSLSAPWSPIQELGGITCHGAPRHVQPSVSLDEKTLVWVGNDRDSWQRNDIQTSTAIGYHPPVVTAGNTETTTAAETSSSEIPTPAIAVVGMSVNNLLVYPNPTDAQLTIATDLITPDSYFTVFDTNGRELIRQSLRDTRTQVDLGHLPSGIYFIKLVHTSTVEMVKVIKQ